MKITFNKELKQDVLHVMSFVKSKPSGSVFFYRDNYKDSGVLEVEFVNSVGIVPKTPSGQYAATREDILNFLQDTLKELL